MKIRAKLQLNVLVALIFAVIVLAAVLLTQAKVNRLVYENRDYHTLVQKVFGLDKVLDDFLTYPDSTRVRSQWHMVYGSLGEILKKIETRHGNNSNAVKALLEDYGRLEPLINQLSVAQGSGEGARNFSEQREILSDQLSINLASMIALSSNAFLSNQEIIIVAQQRAAMITALLLITWILVSGATFLSLARKLNESLLKLTDGAAIIGSGNLAHRIVAATRDELGQLGQAFNEMAGKLSGTYAALEAEVAERTRAEEALRELNESLEQRVAERAAELSASEERFRVAQELSPDGFTILRPVRDDQGRVVDFTWVFENAAIARLSGTDPNAVVGRRLLELFPGHASSPFLEVYKQAAETGETRVLEAPYHGEAILTPTWFRIVVVSMGEDIAVLAQDTTERKQAETALEQMRNLLSEGEKIAQMGTFEYIAETQTTVWSEQEYRIYGLDPAGPSPAYDVMLEKCIHPDHAVRLHEIFMAAMQSNSLYEFEHMIVRPDGSERWVHDRAIPYFDENGKLIRYVGATLDITERKHAEEALRESERLQRMLAQVGELAALKTTNADLVEGIGAAVAGELGVSRCGLSQVDVTGGQVTVAHDYHSLLPSLAGAYPMAGYASYLDDGLTGRTVMFDDLATDPRTAGFYEEGFAPIQVRAHLTVPLLRHGQWVANFWVSHHEPRPWTTAEAELMRVTADRLWTLVERRRAEEAVKQSQKTFAELIERSPFGTYIVDSQFRIAMMNDASQEGAFRNVRPVIGRDFAEAMRILWPEPVAAEIISYFRHTLDTGEPYYSPRFINPRHDVEIVEAYEWELHRMTLPDGQYSVICYYYDSTKLREAEDTVRKSEERLRFALESCQIGAWDIDLQDHTAYRSLEHDRIFGYQEMLSSWTLDDFLKHALPEYRTPVEAMVREATARKTGWTYECQIRRGDGEVRWIWFSGQHRTDSSGRSRVAGVVLDITERKRMEQELRKSRDELELRVQERTAELGRVLEIVKAERQRFFDVLETLPVYVCLLKPDYHVSFVNRVFREHFGESEEGLRCYEFLFGRNEPCEICETYRVLEDMQPRQWEWTGPNQRIYSVYDFPFIDTDGSSLILEMGIDITERKQAEAELSATVARLEQSNQALQDFASIASHDMREPLRKVISFGNLLRQKYADSLGQTGGDYLNRMIEASQRMQTLLTSLLDYSRVTTTQEPFEEVDLYDLVHVVLSDLEVRIAKTGGEVQVGELPVLAADPTQMRQLFQNLIGNALKFHKEGEKPVVKVLCDASDDANCLLVVEDNGIGFDEQHLDRIFAPFQRLHGRSSPFEGTGMGLAICKKIVERHGGSITARSEPGRGSAFVVTLPIKQDAGRLRPDCAG